jgi:drug/metabolite transporter (DMT)-like permease
MTNPTNPTSPTNLTELTGRERFLAGLAFVTLCFVWGTTFLAIKVAVETWPTLLLTGARFTLAGAALLAVCLLGRQKLPAGRGDWLHLAFVGVLMIGVGNVAVVWALEFLNSGTTALLIATGPFWMGAVEAFRRGGQKFSRTQFVGLLIAFLGIAVLSAPELGRAELGQRFLLGALSVQLACAAWAVGSVRSKYWPTAAGPLTSAAVQMLAGGLAVGVAALLNGDAARVTLTPRALAAFLYLTVFGSVAAYTSYVYALAKLSTATVALSDYIIPGIAVLLGWLVLGEPFGWRTLIALALILAGVAFDQAAGRVRAARRLRGGQSLGEDGAADQEVVVTQPN